MYITDERLDNQEERSEVLENELLRKCFDFQTRTWSGCNLSADEMERIVAMIGIAGNALRELRSARRKIKKLRHQTGKGDSHIEQLYKEKKQATSV